jgi:hypothetical protein
VPKAIVTYGKIDHEDFFVEWTRDQLPALIALRLGVPGTDAELSPADVEVRFERIGPDDISGPYLLEIEIRANDYPERRAVLKNGTQEIWDEINKGFPELNGRFFVWPRLAVGEFVDGPRKTFEAGQFGRSAGPGSWPSGSGDAH